MHYSYLFVLHYVIRVYIYILFFCYIAAHFRIEFFSELLSTNKTTKEKKVKTKQNTQNFIQDVSYIKTLSKIFIPKHTFPLYYSCFLPLVVTFFWATKLPMEVFPPWSVERLLTSCLGLPRPMLFSPRWRLIEVASCWAFAFPSTNSLLPLISLARDLYEESWSFSNLFIQLTATFFNRLFLMGESSDSLFCDSSRSR